MRALKLICLTFIMTTLLSCAQNPKSGTEVREATQKRDTTITPPRQIYTAIPDTVVKTIRAYFVENFGDSTSRLEETVSDTLDNMVYYAIPKAKDDWGGFLIDIEIPKADYQDTNHRYNPIHGDLNGDGVNDEIIYVHTEGDGVGGNTFTDYFFLYLSNNGTLQPAGIYCGFELCNCPTKPHLWANGFFPQKIENGYLIGESACYTENDGHCCPSLHYTTKVKLVNGKLVFAEQRVLQKKPVEGN